MYPIINLRHYRQDIHWYLRALEETIIRTLGKLGVRGTRIEGLTGVWVDGRKVAVSGSPSRWQGHRGRLGRSHWWSKSVLLVPRSETASRCHHFNRLPRGVSRRRLEATRSASSGYLVEMVGQGRTKVFVAAKAPLETPLFRVPYGPDEEPRLDRFSLNSVYFSVMIVTMSDPTGPSIG